MLNAAKHKAKYITLSRKTMLRTRSLLTRYELIYKFWIISFMKRLIIALYYVAACVFASRSRLVRSNMVNARYGLGANSKNKYVAARLDLTVSELLRGYCSAYRGAATT